MLYLNGIVSKSTRKGDYMMKKITEEQKQEIKTFYSMLNDYDLREEALSFFNKIKLKKKKAVSLKNYKFDESKHVKLSSYEKNQEQPEYVVATPKKRGRPAKVKAEAVAEAVLPTPKKRGRPAKVKVKLVSPKKVGKPKKETTAPSESNRGRPMSLLKLRKSLGLNQTEMAKRLSVSQGLVCQIEKGKIKASAELQEKMKLLKK